jgi:putative transposase
MEQYMSTNPRLSVRRSREQWQRLINEQQKSNLTQAEFCQQHDLAVSSFCNWKRRLLQDDATRESSEDNAWLSLPEQLFTSSGNWRIELDLGDGVCLRLTQG